MTEVTGGPAPDSMNLVPKDQTGADELGGNSQAKVTAVNNIVSIGSPLTPRNGPQNVQNPY
jgi:hypothetical protein